jgi:hypothetical protein
MFHVRGAKASRVYSAMHRVFILSPARMDGKRAEMLLSERAQFDLAQRLRLKSVPVGEVFSFLSGLYFRGKLEYARTFAKPPRGVPGALVITSNRGLLDADSPISSADLEAFSQDQIDLANPRYRKPLARHTKTLVKSTPPECEFVLLGSIATNKYSGILIEAFGERLRFPAEFVGRGDMSRGGLLLRCVREQRELEYISVAGAVRHGVRPPKLPPLRARRRASF